MTGTMSVLHLSTCNILNWMAASIAWTYPALFSNTMVILKFCQYLIYLKPDLQQSDSGTSQAMWHAIQTAQNATIRTAHNSAPQSNCFMNTDYQRSQKVWIFLKCEKHSTNIHKLNSSSMVITWSAIGSTFSFSATSVTCDSSSFKTSHHIFTNRKC